MIDPKTDVRTERAFLHAISSPISAAHIHLSGVIEDFADREEVLSSEAADLAVRLQQALGALERVTTLIQERKSVVAQGFEKG